MNRSTLTVPERCCGTRKIRSWCSWVIVAGCFASGCADGASTAAPTATTPPPAAPTGPPKPLDGATITITASGFRLDAISAAAFGLEDLHVYQGAALMFINSDTQTHDVLSDLPHVHTDCPEINAAGFLVPGQSRATDPLNRLMTCGFHDHTHEGDEAFAGKVTVEAR